MIGRINCGGLLEPVDHFGQGGEVYQPQAVDRAMPTIRQYMKPLAGFTVGAVPYDNGPLPLIKENFDGRFATADLPRLVLPPAWERIQK